MELFPIHPSTPLLPASHPITTTALKIKMGLTTILRGFKIPVAVLDRFFESNGIMPTFGYPPTYNRPQLPGDEDIPTLDLQSALLRTKLAATPAGAADTYNQNTRIFISNREGLAISLYASLSYAYIIVPC